VLSGEIKTAAGAVALQGMNTSLRALEIERPTFDVAALMERIDALEATASRIRGAGVRAHEGLSAPPRGPEDGRRPLDKYYPHVPAPIGSDPRRDGHAVNPTGPRL
jgi:hypothetical protein